VLQVLYRHAGGNRDGAFTDWFAFTVTSGVRSYLTPVSGVFWVVVELTDRELPALDANIPLTVTQGDLETITAINLHISQAGMSLTSDMDSKLFTTKFITTALVCQPYTARCYAERGNAMASRLSVRLSDCLSVRL